jgi:hypothetical protein
MIGDWSVKIGGWLEIGIEIGTAVPTLPPPLSHSEGLLFHAFAEMKKNYHFLYYLGSRLM